MALRAVDEPAATGGSLVAELLGDGAVDVLSSLLAEDGRTLISARPWQVRYRPPDAVRVVYHVDCERDGRAATTFLALEAGRRYKGGVILQRGFDQLVAWEYPNDPRLPGLASIVEREKLAPIIAQVGFDQEIVSIRVRSYRASKRAVAEVTGTTKRVFVKAVRPSAAEELQRRHVELTPYLPVPHSLGWSEELGIVILEALPGRTLRDALADGGPAGVDVRPLIAALDRLPPASSDAPSAHDPLAATSSYARLVANATPELAHLAGEIAERSQRLDRTADRWVHGDFHLAQVMVGAEGMTGIVDVDRAGAGDPRDDLATLIAHAHSTALGVTNPAPVAELGQQALAVAEDRYDRDDIRTRVAAVMLGFAVGPFSSYAEDWRSDLKIKLAAACEWLPA